MQRRWAVRARPETGFVDRQELVNAIMDGESLLTRAGGVLTIVVDRMPTDLPGEMFTTGAVIEWKDRTDARPQPERPAQVFADPAPAPPAPEPQPEPADPRDAVLVPAGGIPDGLDERALPDEDVSSIEAG